MRDDDETAGAEGGAPAGRPTDRREALVKLAKTATYAAPAMLALLSLDKAAAAS